MLEPNYVKLPVAAITGDNPSRHNGVDPDHVERLRVFHSYSNRLAAVLVRPTPEDPEKYDLLDGEHRLAVAKAEGQTHIWAEIIDADDDRAELNTIISNLARKQYTPDEEAEHTARLVELYEELGALFDNSVDETPRKRGRPEGPVSKAAKTLGISKQAVSKRLQKANGPGSAGRASSKAKTDAGTATVPEVEPTYPAMSKAFMQMPAADRRNFMAWVAEFHADEYRDLFVAAEG